MKTFFPSLLALVVAAAGPAQAFEIHNAGDHTVQNIYQSPHSSSVWGIDRLDGYLDPNHSWTSPLSDDCDYDIKIVYYDGTVWLAQDFDTCDQDLYLNY